MQLAKPLSNRFVTTSTAALLIALGACQEQAPAPETPAESVQTVTPAPPAAAPPVRTAPEVPRGANPHAMNPHAMNPHAANPHAADPHAGLNLPARPQAPPAAAVAGPITALGVTFTAPEGWVAEPPQNSMRRAQYRLPRVDGDVVDGEVTVVIAGGDAPSNVERWRGQFQGNPEAASETREIAGRTVTLATIEGTFLYKERPMAPGPGEPRPEHVMRAVIIPSADGQESIFVKAWGPKATMARWSDTFEALARSVKAAE